MDLGLKGRKALIFGGSSGIGFAIAEALLAEEVQLAICARPGPRLDQAQGMLPGSQAVAADLSKPGEAARATIQAQTALRGLDILIVNTGGPPTGSFESIDSEKWLAGFQSLWLSSTDAIRAALPGMKARRHGRVIFITSTVAREPIANLTVSNGLRAGLNGMIKSLSDEIAKDGITVNAIMPGFIDTDRLKELGLQEEAIVKMIPVGRLGRPSEVGALATFLVSDAAAYLTGQSIACDGGRLRSHA